jgi:hypothetical protein
METSTIKYYGLERNIEGVWVKCGITAGVTDTTYAQVRSALDILADFRVVPIEKKEDWVDVFNDGRIMELTTLCTAIKILCTK